MENKIDQFITDVEDIKKSLEKIANAVSTLSESEMIMQTKNLTDRAEFIKQKIIDEIDKLKSMNDEISKKLREKAETLLESLEVYTKEVSDFYNSIVSNLWKWNEWASEQVDKWKEKDRNIFKKGKDRVVEQWENIKEKPWKYIWGIAISIVGFFWVKWLRNRLFWNKKHKEWTNEPKVDEKEQKQAEWDDEHNGWTETSKQWDNVQEDENNDKKPDDWDKDLLDVIWDWFKSKIRSKFKLGK